MKSSILFVNPTWESEALIRAFIQASYFVIGFGQNSSVSLSSNNYRHVYGNLEDYVHLLGLAKLYDVQAIASDNCDYSLLASEYLSELLNLPCLGRKAAQISNNKSQQRYLAECASIPQPKWKSVLSYPDIVDFLHNTAFKAMLKPVDSRGSMGITLLSEHDSPSHIHKAFAKALSSSPSKQLLVEEYVDGKLLTIDGFQLNGKLILLAIAERVRIGEGKLVTTQIFYRSSLPKNLIDKAYKFLYSVVSALGYSKGHIHCEALLADSNKLFLVECTNRGGGVFTSSTINPYVSSLDVNSMYMNEKQCSKVDNISSVMDSVKWTNTNNASLIFPALGIPGQVLYRFDTEKIRNHPDVLAVRLFQKVGRPLSVQSDGPSRHCAMVIKNSNPDEIDSIAKTLIEKFTLAQ